MEYIKPMLAKSSKLPANDGDYGFEIKWDGMRAVIYCLGGRIKVVSRNQKDVTEQYPELGGLATVSNQVVIDGEIICFDDKGYPSFSRLQHRMGLTETTVIEGRSRIYPVSFMIFDLLNFDGESLLQFPYTERRQRLEKLRLNGAAWQTPAFKKGSGKDIFDAASQMGLEGIVAKRLNSKYYPGKRSGDWLKIKNQKRQELVIGGWSPGSGSRKGSIGALLLGYYDDPAVESDHIRHLNYAGKAGTGFTAEDLRRLQEILGTITIRENPFKVIPPIKDAIYVEPVVVGEFEFTEWTPNGTLRHPSFKGLRIDKKASEVIRESI